MSKAIAWPLLLIRHHIIILFKIIHLAFLPSVFVKRSVNNWTSIILLYGMRAALVRQRGIIIWRLVVSHENTNTL